MDIMFCLSMHVFVFNCVRAGKDSSCNSRVDVCWLTRCLNTTYYLSFTRPLKLSSSLNYWPEVGQFKGLDWLLIDYYNGYLFCFPYLLKFCGEILIFDAERSHQCYISENFRPSQNTWNSEHTWVIRFCFENYLSWKLKAEELSDLHDKQQHVPTIW